MSTKDRAGARWTCKTLCSVQPSTLRVRAEHRSCLLWLRRHWGSAQSITLELSNWTPLELPREAVSLSRLQLLSIDLQGIAWGDSFCMVFAWLLAHAQALRFLELPPKDLPMMPLISNLQHLVLSFLRTPKQSFARTLCGLTTLKTLKLESRPLHEIGWPADLDLGHMPTLTRLSCVRVAVNKLKLPEGCHLHVSGDEEMAVSLDLAGPGKLAASLLLDHGRLNGDKEEVLDYIAFGESLTCLRWHVRKLGCLVYGPLQRSAPIQGGIDRAARAVRSAAVRAARLGRLAVAVCFRFKQSGQPPEQHEHLLHEPARQRAG